MIVKLRDGESVIGWIEYYDDRMIRLTREGKPNLFIYKHQIRTITENAKREKGRTRNSSAKKLNSPDSHSDSALESAPSPQVSSV